MTETILNIQKMRTSVFIISLWTLYYEQVFEVFFVEINI